MSDTPGTLTEEELAAWNKQCDEEMLDAACASLHEKILEGLTAVDYVGSWEFAPLVLAKARYEERKKERET
jgi:hypothetical protein